MRNGIKTALLIGMLVMALASQAQAATTVGRAMGKGTVTCIANTTLQQRAVGIGDPSYTIPPGGGVVTSWSSAVSADTAPDATLRLNLMVPNGEVGGWKVQAASSYEALTTPGLMTFQTRIPVDGGEILGLTVGAKPVDCYEYLAGRSSDIYYQLNSSPPPGATVNYTAILASRLANIAATVEPDADRDGFGDETQDGCPTNATAQGACPPPPPPPATDTDPPETGITQAPADKGNKNKFKFKFTSDEAGSTFECKLDKKPFKPCRSPRRYRVKDGKHKFKVRAIDAAGNVDPTPAKDKFKVT